MDVLKVPIALELEGFVSLTLRDVITGKVLEKRTMKNTILQTFINCFTGGTNTSAMGNFLNWGNYTSTSTLNESVMRECSIGSDSTAVTRHTKYCENPLATVTFDPTLSSRSLEYADPVWVQQTYIFPAGTGTGTIREVGLRQYSPLTTVTHTARQMVDPAIVKGASHQLEIKWTLQFSRGANHPWTGTITAGQRDGVTDIDYAVTINDAQLMTWVKRSTAVQISTDGSYQANPLARWNSKVGLPYVIVGDSNAASVLGTDGQYTIKGNEVFSGAVPLYSVIKDAVNAKITPKIGFNVDDANGDIGEIVMCSAEAKDTDYSYGGLCRITFDPPLDKVDNYQLYIEVDIVITPI